MHAQRKLFDCFLTVQQEEKQLFVTVHTVGEEEKLFVTVHTLGEEEQLFVTLHTVGEEEQLFVTVHTEGKEKEIFVTVHPVGEEEEFSSGATRTRAGRRKVVRNEAVTEARSPSNASAKRASLAVLIPPPLLLLILLLLLLLPFPTPPSSFGALHARHSALGDSSCAASATFLYEAKR